MLTKTNPALIYWKPAIVQYLIADNKPYAAKCFGEENGTTVTDGQLEKWLRGYFAPETAYRIFMGIYNSTPTRTVQA